MKQGQGSKLMKKEETGEFITPVAPPESHVVYLEGLEEFNKLAGERGFDLVPEKRINYAGHYIVKFEGKKDTLGVKINRAYKKLAQGWWDALAELGYDRGC